MKLEAENKKLKAAFSECLDIYVEFENEDREGVAFIKHCRELVE